MREAPPYAFYVWPNSQLLYPRALARSLGREDLQLWPASWLEARKTPHLSHDVVIDHACELDAEQAYVVKSIQDRVNRRRNVTSVAKEVPRGSNTSERGGA